MMRARAVQQGTDCSDIGAKTTKGAFKYWAGHEKWTALTRPNAKSKHEKRYSHCENVRTRVVSREDDSQ